MANYHDFVRGLSPTWARGYWAQRFVGVLYAVTGDTIGVALADAIKAPWFQRGGLQPADALPLLGTERSMPRYPIETNQQHRDRLWGAWDAWEFAGTEFALESQFTAAGFTVEIYEPLRTHSGTGQTHGDWIGAPEGYWSQFWAFFPKEGGHNFGPAATWGSAGLTWGGGWLWGSSGSFEDVQTVRGIVNKFRPAHVICRALIFEISGWTWGTEHRWGEAGLVWGGESVKVDPY